jgi:hypothetical protein
MEATIEKTNSEKIDDLIERNKAALKMEATMERINSMVGDVVSEFDSADEAHREERRAKAVLLSRVVEMIRPTVRAIGTRPVVKYSVQHHADVNHNGGIEDEDRYDHRCLLLSDDGWGPDEDSPRANTGNFKGARLALREDGALVLFNYSGEWSRWQGSSWGWEAEVIIYDDCLEVVGEWPEVEEYIDRIAKALEKARGSRESGTGKAKQRADRLRALATILEG